MTFNKLFEFLRELQKNNSKDWMDANRKEYESVRDFYISWLNRMNDKLSRVDSTYHDTPGRKAINRINNNLMFHPEKPTYKDHFGAGLDQKNKQGDFYIQIGTAESFIGGGYWHPSSKILKSIRQAIDYNGDDFKKIINKASFQKTFGGLVEAETLKTSPKGFSQEHKLIDLLRLKSFAAICPITQKEIMSEDFEDRVVEIYKEMLPFRRYLNQAVTV